MCVIQSTTLHECDFLKLTHMLQGGERREAHCVVPIGQAVGKQKNIMSPKGAARVT